MPFIMLITNITISKAEKKLIKDKFKETIDIIPGKSKWLMTAFNDNATMFFKENETEPMAFIEIKLFGSADIEAYDRLTGAITDIVKEVLQISKERIYVAYQETQIWGWNGSNFKRKT